MENPPFDISDWTWGFSNVMLVTLPETNSSHLKIDGWKTILSFGVWAYFQRRTVSFREGVWNIGVLDIYISWVVPPSQDAIVANEGLDPLLKI